MKAKTTFEDLTSENPKIKYGYAKNLLVTAKDNPAELYPHIDFFVKLMKNENGILKWTAIDIIGLLSKIDIEKKIDKMLDKLFAFLNTGNMITANHAIAALTDITLAKPEYQKIITDELLKVEHYNYETDECRNIALGKVVLAVSSYFDHLKDKKTVIEFVERQTKNTRNATKKKAEKFLKNIKKKVKF
jgi:hypothetical protein